MQQQIDKDLKEALLAGDKAKVETLRGLKAAILNEAVARNAREALNFHLSILLYGLCCIPLIFIVIGIPILVVLGIASLVLGIIAAVKASDDKKKSKKSK